MPAPRPVGAAVTQGCGGTGRPPRRHPGVPAMSRPDPSALSPGPEPTPARPTLTPAGAAARRALAMLIDCQALAFDIRAVGGEPDGPLSDRPRVAAARQVWHDGSGFAARYHNLVARLAGPVPADALDALRSFRAADRGMDGVTWSGGPLGLVAELSAVEAVEALARRFLMEIDQAVRDEYPPAREVNPSHRPDLTGPQYVPVRHRVWASGRCPIDVFTGDNYRLMWRSVRAEGEVAARATAPPVPVSLAVAHASHPDGPAVDGRTVRFGGHSVTLDPVPWRVAAFMWSRTTAGFDELAAYVNENRSVSAPADSNFHTWATRTNDALRDLKLPWRLSADTLNRIMTRPPAGRDAQSHG